MDGDAVLFWVVWDAQKAALEVEDYRAAIAWAAQTALRDSIGKMLLADILVGRDAIDHELQRVIDERTTPCGGAASAAWRSAISSSRKSYKTRCRARPRPSASGRRG